MHCVFSQFDSIQFHIHNEIMSKHFYNKKTVALYFYLFLQFHKKIFNTSTYHDKTRIKIIKRRLRIASMKIVCCEILLPTFRKFKVYIVRIVVLYMKAKFYMIFSGEFRIITDSDWTSFVVFKVR